jgi:hypothetical protein
LHRGALRVTATGKNQGNKGKAVLRTVMRESSGNSKQVMGTCLGVQGESERQPREKQIANSPGSLGEKKDTARQK